MTGGRQTTAFDVPGSAFDLRRAVDVLAARNYTDGHPAIVAVVVGAFFVGLLGIYLGYSQYRTGTAVVDTETETVGDVTPGRTAIAGTIRPAEETLERPFTDGECVYYRYEIGELMETEGQRRSRSRQERRDEITETEWKTRAKKSEATPFYVEDGTGTALVEADEGASFSISSEHSETISENYDRPKLGEVTELDSESRKSRTRQRKYSQSVLPPDADVFVTGGAREPSDEDVPAAVVIGGDEGTGDFVVSERGADVLVRSYSRRGPLVMLVGAGVSALMLFFLVSDFVLA